MAARARRSRKAERSTAAAERTSLRVAAEALVERLKNNKADLQEGIEAAQQLREAREFDLLDRVTDQLRQLGHENPKVRRLYAQSLIERGKSILAIDILESSAARLERESFEWAEAHGVMGRAWKQLFFDAQDKTGGMARKALANAMREYLIPYNAAPAKYVWQGLNLLALATYVERERLSVEPPIDCQRLARNILSILAGIPQSERDNWYYASLAEAHLALNDLKAVEDNIRNYVTSPHTSAFALGGTLRQFTVLWSLDKKDKREYGIVQALRAALMEKEFGHLELKPDQFQRALAEKPSSRQLESILGPDGPMSFKWWQLGVECAKSVGVICQGELTRVGTGFLMRGDSFKAEWGDELFVVTNAHVVSDNPDDGGIPAQEACIKFEAVDSKSYAVADIMAISGKNALDTAILRLKDKVTGINPLRSTKLLPVLDKKQPQRVYVIGYPGGGELKVSFQDSVLLDHEGPPDGTPVNEGICRLHYRTPTEKGSSGSPVFNASAWQVVALHHAGGEDMLRLNGKNEQWPANEGIWIKSILDFAAQPKQ
jgi:hypothetical protein